MIVPQKNSTLLLACASVLVLAGCHRQKPVVLLPKEPPQATAPADTAAQQQAPQTTEQQPAPAKEQEKQQSASNTTTTNPPAKPPAKPRHTTRNKPSPEHPATEKQPTQEAKITPPQKIVIQEGGSTAPGASQISTNPPSGTQGQDKVSTDELLDTADKNLRSIKRQLSTDEQSMLTQAREYLAQSRQAIKDGDMGRAHNLAWKARQLSDELVKPQ
jgi:cytoskeletal protein RodZ